MRKHSWQRSGSNRLKYLQADFDNYRKWSEKEKGAIIALANENLIKDLLVILDDFERALPSLEQEKNREGVFDDPEKTLENPGRLWTPYP